MGYLTEIGRPKPEFDEIAVTGLRHVAEKIESGSIMVVSCSFTPETMGEGNRKSNTRFHVEFSDGTVFSWWHK